MEQNKVEIKQPKEIEFFKSIILDKSENAKKFKVGCELSGTGYGAFKHWERIYTCENEMIAKEESFKELKPLQEKGVMVTGLYCRPYTSEITFGKIIL